jgi:ABC-type branched-subunit amino acid transport system ATPase component
METQGSIERLQIQMRERDVRFRAHDVHFSYGATSILRGVNLDLQSGDVIVVAGENGSGKTTLMDVFSGFVKAQQAKIEIDGALIKAISPMKCANRGIVRTFQEPRVFDQMSVLESLLLAERGGRFPLLWQNLFPSNSLRNKDYKREKRCHGLLRRIGWDGRESVQAGELSYGQRKLLAVCQAIVSPASIMFLDEPTAGSDDNQRKLITKLLQEWLKTEPKHCILITTHEVPVFYDIATQVLRLAGGVTKAKSVA